MALAIMISAIVGLQLGPLGVVLETYFSGISDLPFSTFLLLMQPIHLAIGFVEGLVTVAVVSFVYKARPEILQTALEARPIGTHPVRNLLLAFLAVAILTGGIVSWYASENPDGLEWAIAKVTGKEELQGSGRGLYGVLASLQKKTAILPDYSFKKSAEPAKETAGGTRLGTSVAGILGAMMTLAAAFIIGIVLKKREQTA
jgi:cobalt/nickel transport system permease protein